METSDAARALRRTGTAIVACAVVVAACYVFVDRPVAYFVRRHDLDRFALLKWLTLPPPWLQAWSPAVLVALCVRRAWGPWRPWERAWLAAAVAIVVADQCRESLADCCGRYWPETWIDDNPSLIRDGAYGFHPFGQPGDAGSFPSGHAARTASVAAVAWIAAPRLRWIAVASFVAVAIGLIGINYHFVGDVIAGGCVGAIVGAYAALGCGAGADADRPVG